MAVLWDWKTRDDGLCERSGCGRPSYAWSSRDYMPAVATRTVMALPLDESARGSYGEPSIFVACGIHGGVLKRKGSDVDFKYVVLNEVVEDRETTLKAAMADLRKEQREAAEATRRYIAENRERILRNFVASGRDGGTFAKLLDPDEYGRQFIKVSAPYYTGLTPDEAETLAHKLLELAGEARTTAEQLEAV